MNSFIASGNMTELACGPNFAYLLNSGISLVATEYKVLQSQTGSNFIKCMKMLFDGETELYYLTSGKRTFSSMLPELSPESFIAITAELIKCVNDVRANGFLSCQKLDISFDKIYIDPRLFTVSLVYIPVDRTLYDDYSSFENELRSSLRKLLSGAANLYSPWTVQLSVDLSDGGLSLNDIYNHLNGGVSPQKETQRMRLVSENTPEHIEFNIGSEDFVIGRNPAVANGVVPDTRKAIGKAHCRITQESGLYYVTDLKSVNGTFINEAFLQADRKYRLNNGDVLRLANSSFAVYIG